MITINPYLNYPGTTEEAFNFYKSIFGGEFTAVQRFKDMPDADNLSAEDKEKIMHIELPIGKGVVIMATDALESMGQSFTMGNNFFLAISAESEEEADRFYNALSAGGEQTMPMQKMFWGDYFGTLTDKFGLQWMIGYTYK